MPPERVDYFDFGFNFMIWKTKRKPAASIPAATENGEKNAIKRGKPGCMYCWASWCCWSLSGCFYPIPPTALLILQKGPGLFHRKKQVVACPPEPIQQRR